MGVNMGVKFGVKTVFIVTSRVNATAKKFKLCFMQNNEFPGANAPGIIIIRFSQSSPAPGVPGGNLSLIHI